MQVKALKSFDSKPLKQHIRAGMTFYCEPRYGNELKRNKLVEVLADESRAPGSPEPSSNKSIPAAPARGGKDQAPPPPSGPAPSQEGGQAQPSASSPAAPASRAKTVTTSSVGGRRGVVTPRRKTVVTKKPAANAATITPAK